MKRILTGAMVIGLCCGTGWAQKPTKAAPSFAVDQPNAGHTRDEFQRLLNQYPPTVRQVLAIDPELLGNEGYLAQYPALAAFVGAHPEIARNGSFYAGEPDRFRRPTISASADISREAIRSLGVLCGILTIVGALTWLIRTLVDYRRWNRLTKIQTDVHTRLLERFTSNEELMAYVQSPAGAKFLESSPILLDPGPKQISAPLGRIMWSLQAGLVLAAAGVALLAMHVEAEVQDAVQGFGTMALALGIGFVLSAGVSYVISRRLGLITAPIAKGGE